MGHSAFSHWLDEYECSIRSKQKSTDFHHIPFSSSLCTAQGIRACLKGQRCAPLSVLLSSECPVSTCALWLWLTAVCSGSFSFAAGVGANHWASFPRLSSPSLPALRPAFRRARPLGGAVAYLATVCFYHRDSYQGSLLRSCGAPTGHRGPGQQVEPRA